MSKLDVFVLSAVKQNELQKWKSLQLDCSEIYYKYFVATNLVINLGFLHQRIQHIEHTVNIPNLKDKILLKIRINDMIKWQFGIIAVFFIIIVLSSPQWRKSFSIFKALPVLINQLIKTMTNSQTWLDRTLWDRACMLDSVHIMHACVIGQYASCACTHHVFCWLN